MKILHISDTHSQHDTLNLDLTNIDLLVHTGDATNYRSQYRNEKEFFDFINWYAIQEIKNKIYIAGNHDSYIFHNERRARQEFKDRGIIYLNKEWVNINGYKIYGDPTSPNFGNWYFMVNRGKIYKHWNLIPRDVDILLTHTPPQGILDLSQDHKNNFEMCGCSNLRKQIDTLSQLKLHCFGHIHNNRLIKSNFGVYTQKTTKFSNGTCVIDGQFNKGCINQGNIIEI